MIVGVFCGGEPSGLSVDELPDFDLVIAADSGVDRAVAIRLPIDIAVGDFDSVDPAKLDDARASGVELVSHPAAKDATDLELALRLAAARGATSIVMVGGLGGRLDHLLGNLGVLCNEHLAACDVSILTATTRVWVVRGKRSLAVARGTTISLITVGTPAVVTTNGLRWELDHASVPAATSLGISNVADRDNPTVDVSSGVMIAVAAGEA